MQVVLYNTFLKKKKKKKGNSRYICPWSTQTPTAALKSSRERICGHQSHIAPFFWKKEKWGRASSFYFYFKKWTLYPASLKPRLHSQRNTMSSGHFHYYTDWLVQRKAKRNIKRIKWANKNHICSSNRRGIINLKDFCFLILNILFK